MGFVEQNYFKVSHGKALSILQSEINDTWHYGTGKVTQKKSEYLKMDSSLKKSFEQCPWKFMNPRFQILE